MTPTRAATIAVALLLLTACSASHPAATVTSTGNGTATAVAAASGSPAPTSTATAPVGGLYVGSYQEDPTVNPADPMTGSYYLVLPGTDGPFTGAMAFDYVGCGSHTGGPVTGIRAGLSLSGTWAGNTDGVAIGGPYTGTWDVASGTYSGTWQNADGTVPVHGVCGSSTVDYSDAGDGTFEMAPVGERSPSDFGITVDGSDVTWTDVAGTATWLASVYDVAKASAGADGVVAQELIPASTGETDQTFPLASLGLTPGTAYVLGVVAVGADHTELGHTSLAWTAP